MKGLRLILFAFLALPLSSMAQTVITYSYDAAGNRTTRTSSIEVAVIDGFSVPDNTGIKESDTGQISINENNLFCYVPEANPEDMHDGYSLEKNYLLNKARLILCHLPSIIVQGTDITQKRI